MDAKSTGTKRKAKHPTTRSHTDRKPAPWLERPRLNLDEVNFVLDMNAQIIGALTRISRLEEEVAELQAKLLVRP